MYMEKNCGKKFGEVKSICIGNVMEIVNSGKNLAKCCNSPNFLLCGKANALLVN